MLILPLKNPLGSPERAAEIKNFTDLYTRFQPCPHRFVDVQEPNIVIGFLLTDLLIPDEYNALSEHVWTRGTDVDEDNNEIKLTGTWYHGFVPVDTDGEGNLIGDTPDQWRHEGDPETWHEAWSEAEKLKKKKTVKETTVQNVVGTLTRLMAQEAA